MNQIWQQFLTQHGAHVDHDAVTHFDTVAAEIKLVAKGNVIADLSHIGLIKAEGPEAQTFLHNQLTNDLKALTEHQSQLSAYCNPKGRILTLFRVFMHSGCYYLAMPRDLLEATLKRLRMFILRSQVTLSDASDEMASFGVSGPMVEFLLQAQLGTVPAKVDAAIHTGTVTLLRVPGPYPRFEIHGAVENVIPVWQMLAAGARPVGAAAWQWLDIQAGLPMVLLQTVEAFVPQMVNLQAVNGLNFQKGCYPGQEIVARMQYLGTLKRRMFKLTAATETLPLPGDSIFVHDGASERKAGEIVAAQPAPAGGIDALAVIEIEASKLPLFLQPESKTPLQLQELPYPL
ncbi:MAG: folate-binding protein YgfZ [Gammaproteobacteria bacterium]|nr:folate-binding protein YgfZ [Gammaproteobacteria bacterium]